MSDLADTVVGGATGPGLSGGQKRRLVVALQLLKLPSVIFLDEPTSGSTPATCSLFVFLYRRMSVLLVSGENIMVLNFSD